MAKAPMQDNTQGNDEENLRSIKIANLRVRCIELLKAYYHNYDLSFRKTGHEEL